MGTDRAGTEAETHLAAACQDQQTAAAAGEERTVLMLAGLAVLASLLLDIPTHIQRHLRRLALQQ